ncbi:MAG TPA: hypothetical protein VGC32_16190 [Solirubrobacterales bacterium]
MASSVGSVGTPRVTIDEVGDAVLVWREAGGPILASRRPMTGSWTQGVFISPGGDEAPVVAVDAAGEFFALWSSGEGSGETVEVARRPAGQGGSEAISSPGLEAQKPALALDRRRGDRLVPLRRFGRVGRRGRPDGGWILGIADATLSGERRS